MLTDHSWLDQSDNESVPPVDKPLPDVGNDSEVIKISKAEGDFEENDSKGLEADVKIESVDQDANSTVDPVNGGPDLEVMVDSVNQADTAEEPGREEAAKGDVEMDAETKQVLPPTLTQGVSESAEEGRIDLGGESEDEGASTPAPKHDETDDDKHSEGSEDEKSVSAEGTKDEEEDGDDGDAAEGDKATSESGREDESEERDEEENFVSLRFMCVCCTIQLKH
jgi:hypothetical protein